MIRSVCRKRSRTVAQLSLTAGRTKSPEQINGSIKKAEAETYEPTLC
jgi:hypothetical protein